MHITGRFHQLIHEFTKCQRDSRATHYQITENGNTLILWGQSECVQCGADMLDANWPVMLTSPFGADWPTVLTGKGLTKGVWDENLPEGTPGDLCQDCFYE